MNQATLDAHTQIRFGVESELSYDKNNCNQCNSTRKRLHCHCSKAAINEEMLNLSNEAYKMTPEDQRDEAEITEQKQIELEESENSRFKDLMVKLKSRSTFYSGSHHMAPIYQQQQKKNIAIDKAPKVTTPKVTTPKVTTPKVTTPKVTSPKVTTPKVMAPKVTAPSHSLVGYKIPKKSNSAMSATSVKQATSSNLKHVKSKEKEICFSKEHQVVKESSAGEKRPKKKSSECDSKSKKKKANSDSDLDSD